MRSVRSQQGATLLVVLVMLVMITLFVLSMVRLSSTNLKVIGNMQSQRALESSAQQAVEESISTSAFFTNTVSNTAPWTSGVTSINTTVNGYSITIGRPTCIQTQLAFGESERSPTSLEDTNWEVTASATDALTGAQMDLVQGVKMRLTSGNCD